MKLKQLHPLTHVNLFCEFTQMICMHILSLLGNSAFSVFLLVMNAFRKIKGCMYACGIIQTLMQQSTKHYYNGI